MREREDRKRQRETEATTRETERYLAGQSVGSRAAALAA
jgi:hypothetical protein